MPKVEHWFKQDLKDPVKVHSLNGSVFTFDNVGSVIGVEVFDSGNPVALTGTVNGYVILPDDTTISVAGTRSDNKASINLPQSALAIPGFIKIAVKLTNSSEITTLLAVVATVVKSRTDTIITPSQQIITDWSQQISAQLQAVQTAADNVGATVATPFDSTVAYVAGNYVTYNGSVYRFTTDHAAGEWNASHVSKTSAAQEISNLKSALKSIAIPNRNIDDVDNQSIKNIYLFAGQKITVTNLSSESYPVNVYINPYSGSDTILTFSKAGTQEFTAQKDGYLRTNKASTYNIQMYEDFASPQVVDEKVLAIREYIDNKSTYIKEDIDSIARVHHNYFNVESVIRGKFISGSVGQAYKIYDNSAYYCYVMPVDKNKKYVIERTDFVLYEIDENGIVLTALFPNTETHYREYEVQNQNTAAICFSWTGANPNSFMVLDYGVSFDTYIPYPFAVIPTNELINGIEDATNTDEIYYVGGQSADYQSFSQCLKALKNNSRNKTIYVNSGEYDIFEEMGGQAYVESIDASTANFRDVCDIVPPNTKIIGLGDVVLKYTPTDTEIVDAAHAFLFSPLNITGSCYIENITVLGSNCRYAIHIENGSTLPEGHDAEISFKNVRAKRLAGNIGGRRQCVGCGIGIHAKWSFENCLFESDSDSIFTVHTNSPTVSSSDMITFNNCVIKLLNDEITNYVLCVFINGYLDSSNKVHHNYVFINNCYIRGKIKTQKWSGSTTNVQSWDVQVINTWNTGIVESETDNKHPIKVYGYTGQ